MRLVLHYDPRSLRVLDGMERHLAWRSLSPTEVGRLHLDQIRSTDDAGDRLAHHLPPGQGYRDVLRRRLCCHPRTNPYAEGHLAKIQGANPSEMAMGTCVIVSRGLPLRE